MKKLLLAALLMLTVVACGSDDDDAMSQEEAQAQECEGFCVRLIDCDSEDVDCLENCLASQNGELSPFINEHWTLALDCPVTSCETFIECVSSISD